MNYYPHHIGDFDKATRHLSRIERSVYRDLIELYYRTENQLTLNNAVLCRLVLARSIEESTAVEQTLNEFFTKTTTGWYHYRCEAEIDKYRANSSQKALAGKASAAAKALKSQQIQQDKVLNGVSTAIEHTLNGVSTAIEHTLNGVSTAVEHTLNGVSTNQEPRTINQEPKTINQEPKTINQEPFTTAIAVVKEKTRSKSKDLSPVATFVLPSWIDRPDWELWLKTRKGKKMISEQMQAQIDKLSKWRADGLDHAKALSDAATAGWQGLFEPKSGIQKNSQSQKEQARDGARRMLFGRSDVNIFEGIKNETV